MKPTRAIVHTKRQAKSQGRYENEEYLPAEQHRTSRPRGRRTNTLLSSVFPQLIALRPVFRELKVDKSVVCAKVRG
jgi:hypothetical protein